MQDPGGAGVLLSRNARMADDDQAPVQVVMDGQEEEILLKDVHPLSHHRPAQASLKWQPARVLYFVQPAKEPVRAPAAS